ncbi:MAG: type II toxin-antitoxin system VapC family toxin [Burkholderiaceae bacterium]|nr:type II toxin-antitoxin system VapC family toxin [Burkholderiaceae bacterium]
MSYLVDTNVLSELRRKSPDRNVVEWFEQRPAHLLFVSVLTLGEIRKGVECVTERRLRARLNDWLASELPAFFSGRVLDVDDRVADRWGRLLGGLQRPVPAIDSLLAATAATHALGVVTRNVRDFDFYGIEVIDPWMPEEGDGSPPPRRVNEPSRRR